MEKRKKQYWILGLLVIIVEMAALALASRDQIRELSKRNIFHKVVRQEEALSQLIGRYRREDRNLIIHLNQENGDVIPYKQLEDKEIAKAFKQFQLMGIDYKKNGDMVFYVYPYLDLLIEGYISGFYYSEQDEPIKGEGEEIGDLEYESDGLYYHWYKTEKITDHWWYFEEIISFGGKAVGGEKLYGQNKL